jgi:hypothetical protein
MDAPWDAWVATRTRAEEGRTYVDLTAQLRLEQSRARLWRYPPGVREELFVVLEGTLTLVLGDPRRGRCSRPAASA